MLRRASDLMYGLLEMFCLVFLDLDVSATLGSLRELMGKQSKHVTLNWQ